MKEKVSVSIDGGGAAAILSRNPEDGTVRYLRVTEPTSFMVGEIEGKAPEDKKTPYLSDRKFNVHALIGADRVRYDITGSPMTRAEAEKVLYSIYRGLGASRIGRRVFKWTGVAAALLLAVILFSPGPSDTQSIASAEPEPGLAEPTPAGQVRNIAPGVPDITANAIHFGAKADAADKTLLVFTDPLCPFCKELEAQLAVLPKNIAVRVFPVAFKPGSSEVVDSVYCSIDKAKAWRSAVLDGEALSKSTAECSGLRQLAANNGVFSGMGFRSTPTIINGSGKVKVGAMSASDLIAFAAEK